MSAVTITEYTDPGCPWAYSAEPSRRRLSWLYGDQLQWDVRMVGLSENPDDAVKRGFTPERQSQALRTISREHGMPMDTGVRERMAATVPACRAVVAARLHAPEHARRLLRGLRVRHFAGQLLDEPATIDGAAADAGLDPGQLREWMTGEDVAEALRADMAAARDPLPAALALADKLARWPGGYRYTCPSYELRRADDGDDPLVAPGFQPLAAYEVALANLAPELERRAAPEGVEEVLAWAGTPLATKEVAVVCDITVDDARERLARVAVAQPLGYDAFWTLPG